MTTKKNRDQHVPKPLYTDWDTKRAKPIGKEKLVFDGQDEQHSHFRRDYARLVHCASFRRLQGKTQLFPGIESDFFRNRLTHSIEVAQIAKGIALNINTDKEFQPSPINTDIVELAALAHDLGHPPFGHNGEHALDESMYNYGGFEGNAQTLRIISRLEKHEQDDSGPSERTGLNLTYRSIAAILKYNRNIPILGAERAAPNKVEKGFYATEADLIAEVKKSVAPNADHSKFKTIECEIMDIADDIAYSTYDLEDAFKAGFFNPLRILSLIANTTILPTVTKKVSDALGHTVEESEIQNVLVKTFGGFMADRAKSVKKKDPDSFIKGVIAVYSQSEQSASDGHLRTQLTSELVREFVGGVRAAYDRDNPALSKIVVDHDIRLKIEALKHLTFEALTMSTRMRLVEYRGRDIVKGIFSALTEDGREGHLLLPDDWREAHANADEVDKKRVICDFIAGMTDRYATEFYARLRSTAHEHSFFKPS